METDANIPAENLKRNLDKLPSAIGSRAVHNAFTEKAVHAVEQFDHFDTDIDAILEANASAMSKIAS